VAWSCAADACRQDPGQHPIETYGNAERRGATSSPGGKRFRAYLEIAGCAVPACPCVIHHRLNIPQADYIRAMLEALAVTYPKSGVYKKDGTFMPKK
jgi:hypothetical protein